MAINRRTLSRELKTIEGHVGHPFFRTRDAIKAKKPDVDILDAMELDRQWIGDIYNEADKMVSKLVAAQFTYSKSS